MHKNGLDRVKEIWKVVSSWFYDTVIKPVTDFGSNMWSQLTNGANTAFDQIKNIFGKLGNFFGDIFGSAWNKVKDIFSTGGKIFDGIKDGISDSFTNIVNSLISGINRTVSVPFNSINSALSKIRNVNIAGVQPFSGLPSVEAPSIPFLAEGGFFKANQPTLAIVGDNKRQSEIVSPMDKMEEAFENVLARKGIGANTEIVELLKMIIRLLQELDLSAIIDLDGDDLNYRLEKKKKKKEFATNGGF